MKDFYSSETHTLMLISLLKSHGIKKIVISPGATNICFVASVQHDDYFELYSSVDERSAAYMACGMAAESGEPVALSCTGATASRNYMPGLTEAYYRQLPILAITSSQHLGRVGQYFPQVIDRANEPYDVCKVSINVQPIASKEDSWATNTAINNALLELKRNGGGPVHINLVTTYSRDYTTKDLPEERVIRRYEYTDILPDMPRGRVGIFVGEHEKWTKELTDLVDSFCEKYNAVVLCDHTSNYRGRYKVFCGSVCMQKLYDSPLLNLDLVIYLGRVSGAYFGLCPKASWRVNPDGEIRDIYANMTSVFQMKEEYFFEQYNSKVSEMSESTYLLAWTDEINRIMGKVPNLPYSNIWMAKELSNRLPERCSVYLGILNTLRSWNFFEVSSSKEIDFYSNVGGFGIDGGISSLIGASIVDSNKIFFGIVGDLSFFYDMNSIGNRHVGNNLRLMVVNNGCGTEFKNYTHLAYSFGPKADAYIAARGHFGKQSRSLIKHYATDLGFQYLSAENKEEFLEKVEVFVAPEMNVKPIVFEVFVSSEDESEALKLMNEIETSTKGELKQTIKKVIGPKATEAVKNLINRK